MSDERETTSAGAEDAVVLTIKVPEMLRRAIHMASTKRGIATSDLAPVIFAEWLQINEPTLWPPEKIK